MNIARDMSHAPETAAISALSFPCEISNRDRARHRKRAERARHRAAGRVAVTVHVPEEWRGLVRTVEAVIHLGGPVAERLVRMIRILDDKLPSKRRARLRAGRITRAEARAAQVVFLHSARTGREPEGDAA